MTFAFRVNGHAGSNGAYDEAAEKDNVQGLISDLLDSATLRGLTVNVEGVQPEAWQPNTLSTEARRADR